MAKKIDVKDLGDSSEQRTAQELSKEDAISITGGAKNKEYPKKIKSISGSNVDTTSEIDVFIKISGPVGESTD